MVYIYVIKLQQNKYYVGKTTNPNFRLNDHFNSSGSEWTKKYKPITVHELRPDCENKDETIITQDYMKKYGIDNVRGGPWCDFDISAHKKTILKIIDSESDNCYNCGKSGHFANNCPNNNVKEKTKKTEKKKKTSVSCERCGRNGHKSDSCYAKTDILGDIINDEDEEDFWNCKYCEKSFDSFKGCSFHENVHCKSKNKSKKKPNCTKCGKMGHYASNCYVKKNNSFNDGFDAWFRG